MQPHLIIVEYRILEVMYHKTSKRIFNQTAMYGSSSMPRSSYFALKSHPMILKSMVLNLWYKSLYTLKTPLRLATFVLIIIQVLIEHWISMRHTCRMILKGYRARVQRLNFYLLVDFAVHNVQ